MRKHSNHSVPQRIGCTPRLPRSYPLNAEKPSEGGQRLFSEDGYFADIRLGGNRFEVFF